MPLPSETEYWDVIADKSVHVENNRWSFTDNSWKRPFQLRNLMKYSWVEQKVLEVGTGNAVIASVIKNLVSKNGTYTGIDVSDKFVEWSRKVYGLTVIKADVREIPGDGYTRVIAFDSLEHVRPEHRPEGFRKIFEATANGGLFFLHFSYGKSHHLQDFDHPFGTKDLLEIEKTGFTLETYERTVCPHPKGDIPYVFVTFSK